MAKRKKKAKPIKPTVDLSKPKPHWNGVVLRYDGKAIAHLSSAAEEMGKVLDAFQASGWAESIPNPWASDGTADAQEHLRDVVRRLNEKLKDSPIGFRSNHDIEWFHRI